MSQPVAGSAVNSSNGKPQKVLLVGPYDPSCGEYTFIAPPLGVWRLQGHLAQSGTSCEVFDANCCSGDPHVAFRQQLDSQSWDLIGFSTTGMTLRFDLELVHLAKRHSPTSYLVAGGMEATFNPQRLFEHAPIDAVILGEGERPLGALVDKLADVNNSEQILGLLTRDRPMQQLGYAPALNAGELRDSIFNIPYESMPFEQYWKKLEHAYQVDQLSVKAEREARLSEVRAIRLITLNYCPMNCSFCSSTNFLHAAQGGASAKIARLDADDCIEMIKRIVKAQPGVRTIIFQDDIFCFTKDTRIIPLCEKICEARESGEIPRSLGFISTNRIDAMTDERLQAMSDAGFRVLGFGIENFSKNVLEEFNKGQIHKHITKVLTTTLKLGMTPFLDVILSSPRSSINDLAENIYQIAHCVDKGCEVGAYPYVIPFSGAKMSRDPSLEPYTRYQTYRVNGTKENLRQGEKILPIDPVVQKATAEIELAAEDLISRLSRTTPHVPSRVRSLLWVQSAIPILAKLGCDMPSPDITLATLKRYLPSAAIGDIVGLPADTNYVCAAEKIHESLNSPTIDYCADELLSSSSA